MAVQERSRQTRSQILLAASERFSSFGYDATSVSNICDAAGVSKGAFYHHFESKHAVFTALLDDWLKDLDAALGSARAGAQSVPEALLKMVELTPLVFQAADGRLPIFLQFWTQAARDPAVWNATLAPFHRYHEFFASLLRAGIEEGTIAPTDADTVAHAIVAMAIGLVLQGTLEPSGADWPRVTREGIGLLLASIRMTEKGASRGKPGAPGITEASGKNASTG